MKFLPLLFLLALGAAGASAQTRASDEVRPSPNASVGQTIGTTDVTLTYGRPSVRGRSIFGPDTTSLEPHGTVWRLGANEATTITLSKPVTIAGQPLAAGTYSMFAVLGEQTWTMVFNRTAEQWGAYRYDEAQDALRVAVPVEAFPHTVEMFTAAFDDVTGTSANLVFTWDRTRVSVPIATTG